MGASGRARQYVAIRTDRTYRHREEQENEGLAGMEDSSANERR
jgi:hypothetical protein